MVEREKLTKLSDLALRNRRQGLTKLLPPVGEVLRGSLMERYPIANAHAGNATVRYGT
jgi:hypothetical protein